MICIKVDANESMKTRNAIPTVLTLLLCKNFCRYTEKAKRAGRKSAKSTRSTACQWLTFTFWWTPTPRLTEPRKNKPTYRHGDKKTRNKYWGKQRATVTHQHLTNPFCQLSQTWLQTQWRKKPTPLRGGIVRLHSHETLNVTSKCFLRQPV